MLFGNKPLYEQVRRAKLVCAKLTGVLELLRHWVSERYLVSVLYVVYDTIEIGPHQGRPRLTLILETDADYDSLRQDRIMPKPDVSESIRQHFAAIVTATESLATYDATNVHVVLDNFSDESIVHAVSRFLHNDKQRVLDEFDQCNIWDIAAFAGSIVVFYDNEKVRRRRKLRQLNDCDDAIWRRCFELVKQYDEFGYLCPDNFQFTFDTKDNLNRNYGGSLFNYFR